MLDVTMPAGLFADMSATLGMVLVEKHIVEALIGARTSHCFGHHFTAPRLRLAFHRALAAVIGAPGQIEQRTAKAYRCRISRHLAQRLTNAIDRHPSRLAQFDAQLMMVAHDHDVPSTAGPRLQAGRDRLDQIHDRMAHHHPIVFTQVSHGHCHI